jgi:hypothetical protein
MIMQPKLRATHLRYRRLLFGGSLFVILASVTALAFASHRIEAEQSAFTSPVAGRCVPTTLNRTDILPGTPVEVTPLPDSYDALPQTQISFLGFPSRELAKVTVYGSASGTHAGRVEAYSQGDGDSFVPSKPFISGETVTVRAKLLAPGHTASLAFHFVIAHPDVLAHPPSINPTEPSSKMHFHSRPDLEPPQVIVTAKSATSAPGYIFTSPYNGPGKNGPMIFDESGNLIWFDPLPAETEATNLQVQQLGGQPVLTFWEGYIPPQGFGEGEEVIFNSHYRQIARIKAGNGYKADLHDFHLTPQGTAVLTAFNPIQCDLATYGGPKGGAVTDTMFQEIDIHTGLVRREWHAVDHVSLGSSESSGVTATDEWPWDYFHLNSIDQEPDGTTLLSARNTWALYETNSASGQVQTVIGGKYSTVALLGGTATAFQHDATALPDGDISIFDNGAVPAIHPQSRAVIETINHTAKTANLVTQIEHPTPLSAGSQGNVQVLPNGDYFMGWGAEPYFSEFSPSGKLLFDAHMLGKYQAYRAYRFQWTGEPLGAPAVAATKGTGGTTVYASWNGDTRTAAWELLAGSSAKHLAPVEQVPKSGFETSLPAPAGAKYVAAQALDANGTVLATSPVISG